MKRSYYSSSINDFINADSNGIIGELTLQHEFSLVETQRGSWLSLICILKKSLVNFTSGHLLLEYTIPRMGKRVDAVLLLSGLIIPIEYKQNADSHSSYAIDQVMDYALDLKNFQQGSHDKKIFPIVLASKAPAVTNDIKPYKDMVYVPLCANAETLAVIIESITKNSDSNIDPIAWENSKYSPTPTIIEAAQALYKGHHVKDISRSDSGVKNLHETSSRLSKIIEDSKHNNKKAICFVTGVPGAGKTLAGLNIANERHKCAEQEHAIFLSGNGPLVSVLQEALARDKVQDAKLANDRLSKKVALSATKAFIQNIHHFRDDHLKTDQPPIERVAIFDEAQRAWTLNQTKKFMEHKKGVVNFDSSEPQFLMSVMDRHQDWSVIVCLIGGGQEINTGEAGMPEWFKSIRENFSHWDIYVSSQIGDFEYTQGGDLFGGIDSEKIIYDSALHLSVSVRSFRSELLSEFVKATLDCSQSHAIELFQKLISSYPIAITRNFDRAKHWLKDKARGSERYGILSSSGAHRLRSFGINVKAGIDPKHWFLNSKDDVRSSYYLEDVATEFEIQGLELDWACLAWDANFRFNQNSWHYLSFKGTKWQNIKDSTNQLYLKNAYRVLLTRARQGMVIFIPEGNDSDRTMAREYYDSTYDYLASLGIPLLNE